MSAAHKVVEWLSYGALIYMLAIILLSFGAIVANHFDHKKSQKRGVPPASRRAPVPPQDSPAGAHQSLKKRPDHYGA